MALGGHAEASVEPAEAGRYVFETAVPTGLRLDSDPLTSFLAGDRNVEIRWVARESPGLHAYRLTTAIEGGALAGTVARWTIAPGTGQRLDSDRLLEYRLRLPLLIESGLQIHAALEAVGLDGTHALLVKRDVVLASGRGEVRFARWGRPRLTGGDPGASRHALAPAPDAAPAPTRTMASLALAEAFFGTESPTRASRVQAQWGRGPPSS